MSSAWRVATAVGRPFAGRQPRAPTHVRSGFLRSPRVPGAAICGSWIGSASWRADFEPVSGGIATACPSRVRPACPTQPSRRSCSIASAWPSGRATTAAAPEEAYVGWVRRYILFHRKRHPREMGEPEVAAFLSDLLTGRRVAGSTHNQALSALLFLYREVLGRGGEWGSGLTPAVRPARLPVELTRGEVGMILGRLQDPVRLVCELLYGAGLRLLEALTLRVKDLDEVRGEIRLRDGKGRKDRVTVLP
jgi:hypothetical protein